MILLSSATSLALSLCWFSWLAFKLAMSVVCKLASLFWISSISCSLSLLFSRILSLRASFSSRTTWISASKLRFWILFYWIICWISAFFKSRRFFNLLSSLSRMSNSLWWSFLSAVTCSRVKASERRFWFSSSLWWSTSYCWMRERKRALSSFKRFDSLSP